MARSLHQITRRAARIVDIAVVVLIFTALT
jgi:hypothetical protein